MFLNLGGNSKLTALPTERPEIRRFYTQVLQYEQTKIADNIDTFRIGANFFLGVVYDDAALSMADRLKSLWLELLTDELRQLKSAIINFGVEELEYWDKDHFYFQAPGGQVFRLVDAQEDMSRWRR